MFGFLSLIGEITSLVVCCCESVDVDFLGLVFDVSFCFDVLGFGSFSES